MAAYTPKKKKYNDLLSLHDEMIREGIKNMTYDGQSIQTKGVKYTLAHGVINVTESSSR
jgi:hypothetical protein